MSSLVSWLAILVLVVVALVVVGMVTLVMGRRVVPDWCGGIWWEAEVQQHQATNRR